MWTAQPPELVPTQVEEGRAPGLTYRIEGDLVPALSIALDGSRRLAFEHHVILWKDPQRKMGVVGGSGHVFNRLTGPGRVGIQSAYVLLPTES